MSSEKKNTYMSNDYERDYAEEETPNFGHYMLDGKGNHFIKQEAETKHFNRKLETDISSNSVLPPILENISDKISNSTNTKNMNGFMPKSHRKPGISAESLLDDPNSDSKNRSSRGLRVLSLKVKDIVCEKKETSYKEVAESLIGEVGGKIRGKSMGDTNSKDEQNVKRRVYDALNVLIAADILKKKGKTVFCDDSIVNTGLNKRKKSKEEKDHLEQQINELKKRTRHKSEALQELLFKCLAIKNLLKRNREREKIQNGHGKEDNAKASVKSKSDKNEIKQEEGTSPVLRSSNDEMIKFPFIVLLNNSQQYSMTLNMSPTKRQLTILSRNPLSIFGDIDVLLKMKLHYVSKEFFEQNMPKELQKYLPSSYFEETAK